MCLRVSAVFFSLLSLKYITYSFFCSLCSCCRVSSGGCRAVCPLSLYPFVSIRRAPEAPRRPSVCPVVCPAVCLLAPAVTRPPSGARCRGSVGRCTACMFPAFCPLARHVLPCVPLSVPLLVLCLVLPAVVRPCVCAAAVCLLVAITAYTPLCPGRRRCGAASGV